MRSLSWPYWPVLSIGSAVALIVDMDHPFEGTIVVSAQPMQEALGMIGTP
jgi:hypothetical protein